MAENDTPADAGAPPLLAAPSASPAPAATAAPAADSGLSPRPARPQVGLLWAAVIALLIALIGTAIWLDKRLYATQAEIAARLQAAASAAAQAQTTSQRMAETVRDLNNRLAVIEARQQDLAAQRQALEQLYADVAKSRDQARLAETGQLIALAQQQAQLVGNVQPLISTLQTAAARLANAPNPQAQILRRAVLADLTRLRSAVTPDIDVAARKLDDLAALVDELRLLSSAEPLPHGREEPRARKPAVHTPESAASAAARGPRWAPWLGDWFERMRQTVAQLFGVTRVGSRDALLASPEQGVFLRENLKLRILNARLDLLSRNARAYQSDMQGIVQTLNTYFDRRQPRMVQALSLARQAQQIDLSANPAARLESLAVLSTLDVGAP